MVRPHLEYGNVIWYPRLKRQSIAIERVQRRATSLLHECTHMSYTDRLNYLHLHSLKGRRMRGDLIEKYKIFHAHIDLQWDHFFEAAKTDKTRNSEGKIFVKQFTLIWGNQRLATELLLTGIICQLHWNLLTILTYLRICWTMTPNLK